jgi:hypothetical protein
MSSERGKRLLRGCVFCNVLLYLDEDFVLIINKLMHKGNIMLCWRSETPHGGGSVPPDEGIILVTYLSDI